MWKGYEKLDPPPTRVQPVSLTILAKAVEMAARRSIPRYQASADLLVLGFFFLLRPGEYAATTTPTNNTKPFAVEDAAFFFGLRRYSALAADLPSLNDSSKCTFATLDLDDQKNGVRGETMAHKPTGHALLCPVQSLFRRVWYLRDNHCEPSTPLFSYRSGTSWQSITSKHLTQELRDAASLVETQTGVRPECISARSLRAGGATALLSADTDPKIIEMIGRWHSNSMFRYLHVHALHSNPNKNFAQNMLRNGNFSLVPDDAGNFYLGPSSNPYPHISEPDPS